MKSLLKKLLPRKFFEMRCLNKTYSQYGEDLILSSAIEYLKIDENISYLDIGANHPMSLSNTYLLYKQGASGVLIEPTHR